MSDNPSKVAKYSTVAITALVGLAVGVGTGLLLDFFRSRAPRLVYAISSAEMFPGENQRTGIVLVRIENSGGKEAEYVFCRVSVADAAIKDEKVEGLPDVNQYVKQTGSTVDVNLPFLNAGEQVSLHLLLDLHSPQMAQPSVELRGKGVTGTEEKPGQVAKAPRSEILTLLGTALAALLGMLIPVSLAFSSRARRAVPVIPEFRRPGKHADDQRDVVAYILGVHGFLLEAEQLRRTAREQSYWSIADELTEKWIAAADGEHVRKGILVFEDLLDYASISKSSQSIIQLNVARLASVAGDESKVRLIVDTLKPKSDPLLVKRIAHDPRLATVLDKLDKGKREAA